MISLDVFLNLIARKNFFTQIFGGGMKIINSGAWLSDTTRYRVPPLLEKFEISLFLKKSLKISHY
jgi:hypothetical protein